MTEPKWTPGPWRLGHRQKAKVGVDGKGWFDLAKVVVCLKGSAEDSVEGTANAHLIAAAPDLYAALQAAFDMKVTCHTEWETMARAALAKARGEG